jgi:hypothetical protein
MTLEIQISQAANKKDRLVKFCSVLTATCIVESLRYNVCSGSDNDPCPVIPARNFEENAGLYDHYIHDNIQNTDLKYD